MAERGVAEWVTREERGPRVTEAGLPGDRGSFRRPHRQSSVQAEYVSAARPSGAAHRARPTRPVGAAGAASDRARRCRMRMAGVVPAGDPHDQALLVHESADTRVTRLFLAGRTVVRKEPLGPDAEGRLRHE